MSIMRLNLISGFLLLMLASCCLSGPLWIPMRIGTYTSLRIMQTAASQLGLMHAREMFAARKENAPIFRVTFYGRRFMWRHICTAVVYEYTSPGTVVNYRCFPPLF